MRLSILVLAALVTASAAQSQPTREPQYACAAHAQGDANEDVGVVIQVDASGRQLGSYSVWAPPEQNRLVSRDLDQPDMRLGIRYSGSTEDSIGMADVLRVQAVAFSPPRERVPTSKLRQRLARLSLDYAFDGTVPLRASLVPQVDAIDLPGIASSTADLPVPAFWPQRIDVRLLNSKGAPVNAVTYYLAGQPNRNSLYRAARQAALGLTANPTSCDPAGDMPGQPPLL